MSLLYSRFSLFVCLLFSVLTIAAQDTVFSRLSPDKKTQLQIRIHKPGQIEYRVVYGGKELLNWSPLALQLQHKKSGEVFVIPSGGISVMAAKRTSVNENFAWRFGENATIHNEYNQLLIQCKQSDGTVFAIEARVFDDNLAFRYHIPAQKVSENALILQENTGFRFTDSYTVYRHNTESVISPVAINDLKNPSDFPLVLASDKMYISINEANNPDYTKALLGKGSEANSLQVLFAKDTVKLNGAFTSPWRTLSFSASAIGLCSYSDLLYKLSDKPSGVKKYDWIQPGKLIRDMTLSTAGALSCIDFAAKMNFQYVMFDAGWYGKGYAAEFDKDSDPVKVVPEINMPKVIGYGKEKGIGLILYVNYVGLHKNNLDTLFSLYKHWGVKGLKFGFVKGLTQDGISWLINAVSKAQDYGFIVDVHDNYKPTGFNRTIPAWLTQEGIRGNENNPDAFHNTTLPFTRFLSGPADYTFCYRSQNDSFNNTLLSKKLQVSQAQQLALTVIYYSPLQSMLWYGRPGYYTKPEEIEFFRYVPTVWDKTIHIAGEIGKYVTVARKKSGVWFVGTAVNEEAYSATIKFSFLDRGKKYMASIYADDGMGGIKKSVQEVNAESVWPIKVAAKGGEAMMIKEY